MTGREGKGCGRCPHVKLHLGCSEILACGSSEIIHCVDSEITAVPAVVKKMAARRAAELYHCCRRQQFRSAKAESRHPTLPPAGLR